MCVYVCVRLKEGELLRWAAPAKRKVERIVKSAECILLVIQCVRACLCVRLWMEVSVHADMHVWPLHL